MSGADLGLALAEQRLLLLRGGVFFLAEVLQDVLARDLAFLVDQALESAAELFEHCAQLPLPFFFSRFDCGPSKNTSSGVTPSRRATFRVGVFRSLLGLGGARWARFGPPRLR